jgi:hypothetical protein
MILKDNETMKQRLLIGLLSVILISWASQKIELEEKKILGDKVEILLPMGFETMSEDMMKLKYPSERLPTIVYTDKTGGINVAFNQTANKASQQQIDAFKENFVSTFKNLYPSAEWKATGVKEINGRKVGCLELITPAIDTKIYNLMFFTDLDGRLLLCTFNCVDKKQSEWIEPVSSPENRTV